MRDQIYHLRPSDLTLMEDAITALVVHHPQRLPAALDLAHRLHLDDLERRLQSAVDYYKTRQGTFQMPAEGSS